MKNGIKAPASREDFSAVDKYCGSPLCRQVQAPLLGLEAGDVPAFNSVLL